jgi:hypothetical protein
MWYISYDMICDIYYIIWYGMIYDICDMIYDILYDTIWYDIYHMWFDIWCDIFNRSWVDTRWQQYNTHLHTNGTQNTEKGAYIKIKNLNIYNNKKLYNFGSAGRASSLRVTRFIMRYECDCRSACETCPKYRAYPTSRRLCHWIVSWIITVGIELCVIVTIKSLLIMCHNNVGKMIT